MNNKHLKYIIAAPSYDPNNGGCIVLHKLCDLLNSHGERAMMCPMDFCDYFLYGNTKLETLMRRICHPMYTQRFYRLLRSNYLKYKTNSEWNTPVAEPWKLFFGFGHLDYIVVYPDILSGNMIGARNVVRYLMHNPGHFTSDIGYGCGELLFRYSDSFARNFVPNEGSVISPHLITISTTPSCYSRKGVATKREGTAYIIRKGKGKAMVHDVEHSILLDGKSHEEIASILKRVERLISYDPVTAYSGYALLCGCPSTIILGDDEKPETYHHDPEMRRMFNYSMDDNHVNLKEAIAWRVRKLKEQTDRNENSVKMFIMDSQQFFASKKS